MAGHGRRLCRRGAVMQVQRWKLRRRLPWLGQFEKVMFFILAPAAVLLLAAIAGWVPQTRTHPRTARTSWCAALRRAAHADARCRRHERSGGASYRRVCPSRDPAPQPFHQQRKGALPPHNRLNHVG
jgi:hypothetical protein